MAKLLLDSIILIGSHHGARNGGADTTIVLIWAGVVLTVIAFQIFMVHSRQRQRKQRRAALAAFLSSNGLAVDPSPSRDTQESVFRSLGGLPKAITRLRWWQAGRFSVTPTDIWLVAHSSRQHRDLFYIEMLAVRDVNRRSNSALRPFAIIVQSAPSSSIDAPTHSPEGTFIDVAYKATNLALRLYIENDTRFLVCTSWPATSEVLPLLDFAESQLSQSHVETL